MGRNRDVVIKHLTMNGVGQKKLHPPNTHLMLMTTCTFILLAISVKYEKKLKDITFLDILCKIFSKSFRPCFFVLEV